MNDKTEIKPRYHILDFLRGLALISMILYHLCFDLAFIFGVEMPWFMSTPAYLWQQSIAFLFIILAGFSAHFTRSNAKRGVQIFLLAMLLSLGTYLVFPQELIVFGILHFMGVACLLTALFQKLLNRIPPIVGLILFFCLFLLTKEISYGYLGIGDWHLISLPQSLYELPGLFLFGFPSDSFFSSDYYPIIPWIFLYWTGFYLWSMIRDTVAKSHICALQVPVITLFGRNTLLIYMIHQPIIYGVLFLLHYLNFI